jgi:hypothetical protein
MKKIFIKEYKFLSKEEQKNFTGIIEFGFGTIVYYKNGLKHREDGPARFSIDGTEYWINGVYIKNCTSVEALQLYIDMLKLKNIGANN